MDARINIIADSRQVRTATQDLERLERQGKTTTAVTNQLRTAFAALGGAAVLGQAIRQVASFQAALNGLAAVSNATEEQMRQLEKQARTLGATSMFSAQQAAEGQRFLAQAGFSVNEILSATPGILKLATAGGLDLARAADIASNVLGGMRLEVEELNRVNDVLAATAARSNTSIEQLGQALSFAAPFAAGAGISIEEASAAIGVLSDAGIQASRAGTGLVGVIRQLSKVTTEGERVLNKYGLSTEDVNIESRGLLPVLESLRKANLSTGDAIALFGSEAGAAAQILVQSYRGAIEGATGEADRMARQLERGLIPAFKSFLSAVSESTLIVGSGGIAGALEDLIRNTTGVISVWNGMGEEWAESNDIGESTLATIESIANSLEFMAKAAIAVGGARLAATLTATASSFIAAQIQAVRYQAALASMTGVSRTAAAGQIALATATRGAAAAMALLGGPIGAVVLAGAGLAYVLGQYSEKAETAEERSARLAQEVEGLATAWESLGRAQINAQLLEQSTQAFDVLPQKIAETKSKIESAVNDLNRALATQNRRGRGQSEFSYLNEDVIAARASLADLEAELASLTEQQELSEKSVERLRNILAGMGDEADNAAGSIDELDAASGRASSAFESLAASLTQQIIELRDGADAAEDFAIAQRLGADATDAERNAIAGLVGQLRELRAERELSRERERLGGAVTSMVNELSVGDDPAAQAEDAYFARLSVIDNALAIEAITQEEHRQAELLAEQAYQDELTRIEAEQSEERKRIAEQEAQAKKQIMLSNLDSTASFFGQAADLARQSGEDGFKAYKAFATAQAIIGTYSSAIKAYDSLVGIPFVGPVLATAAAGTAVAFGLAQVAAIRNAQPVGRALGGQVLAGNQYLVGERGPELITMGSNGNVTPYNQLMREARTTNNDTRNITANINVTLPESNEQFQNRIIENSDLIYNVVARVMRDQGMSLGGRR